LVKEFIVDHAHGIFGESASEPGESGMIGSIVVKGKPQESSEGCSVVDLSFQFRVGINAKPLLEQKAFHKYQRRISCVALCALPNGIASHEQVFDSGPIHDGVDLLHSFDGPVLLHGRKEGEIREGEIGLHFLEAHKSSEAVYFKEIWYIIN